MTWENFGAEWHIDHVMPFAMATTPDEIAQLGHYTNLRPLGVRENLTRPVDGSDLYCPWPPGSLPSAIAPEGVSP